MFEVSVGLRKGHAHPVRYRVPNKGQFILKNLVTYLKQKQNYVKSVN
jgi:hypothetical protein